MSFSLSSNTITQTGTDADLSGLSGNGATVTDFGSYKVYNCGSNRLVINGTLSINQSEAIQEQLLVGVGDQSIIDLEVGSTGNLTFGLKAISTDGEYIDSLHFPSIVEKDTGLDFGDSRGKNDAWSGSTAPFFLVRGGASLTWNGTMIACGGLAFDGNSNSNNTDSVIKLNNAVWDARGVSEYSSFDQLLYSYTRDIEIKGITILSIKSTARAITYAQLATPFYPVLDFKAVFSGGSFSGSTSQPVGFTLVIEDYGGVIGNDSANDIQPQGRSDSSTGDVTFLNSARGNALQIGTNQTDSIELIKAEQSVSGTFKTGSGSNISDFIIGTVDKNNLLYSGVGSNGNYDIGNIRLAKWDGGTGTAIPVKTSYAPDVGDLDLYDFYTYSYLYQDRSRLQVSLRNIGGKILEFIGADDIGITENNRATVDAYTKLDNLSKLYDYSKSHKVNNITLPNIDKPQISAQGSTLDLGGLDLDLVASGNVYDCTTSKITVKVI